MVSVNSWGGMGAVVERKLPESNRLRKSDRMMPVATTRAEKCRMS